MLGFEPPNFCDCSAGFSDVQSLASNVCLALRNVEKNDEKSLLGAACVEPGMRPLPCQHHASTMPAPCQHPSTNQTTAQAQPSKQRSELTLAPSAAS
eukprot:s6030_g2.t1